MNNGNFGNQANKIIQQQSQDDNTLVDQLLREMMTKDKNILN